MAARPKPLGKAVCISSPRRRTSGKASAKESVPQTTAAPKAPIDMPATAAGWTCSAIRARAVATPAINSAAWTAAVECSASAVVEAVEIKARDVACFVERPCDLGMLGQMMKQTRALAALSREEESDRHDAPPPSASRDWPKDEDRPACARAAGPAWRQDPPATRRHTASRAARQPAPGLPLPPGWRAGRPLRPARSGVPGAESNRDRWTMLPSLRRSRSRSRRCRRGPSADPRRSRTGATRASAARAGLVLASSVRWRNAKRPGLRETAVRRSRRPTRRRQTAGVAPTAYADRDHAVIDRPAADDHPGGPFQRRP